MSTAIERLCTMAANERPHSTRIMDAVAELGDVREWAEALTELADAIEQLEGDTEQWRDAEGRDDKAIAREDVVAALDQVESAYRAVEALPSMGLGPEVTP